MSAPGPDGIPYGAWAGSGIVSGRTLASMEQLLRFGMLPPVSFNETFRVFAPKADEEKTVAGGDSTIGS